MTSVGRPAVALGTSNSCTAALMGNQIETVACKNRFELMMNKIDRLCAGGAWLGLNWLRVDARVTSGCTG
jgi:hypothetical protein